MEDLIPNRNPEDAKDLEIEQDLESDDDAFELDQLDGAPLESLNQRLETEEDFSDDDAAPP